MPFSTKINRWQRDVQANGTFNQFTHFLIVHQVICNAAKQTNSTILLSTNYHTEAKIVFQPRLNINQLTKKLAMLSLCSNRISRCTI